MLKGIIGKLLGFSNQIIELERRVKELGWDDCFGIHTRAGFRHTCRMQPRGTRVLTFLDFDRIHELNETFGYEEVNHRIKELFSIGLRKSDLAGRHFSGDEIVMLLDVDDLTAAAGILEKLQARASTLGLSFTWAYRQWSSGNGLQDAVIELAEEVQEKKQARRQSTGRLF